MEGTACNSAQVRAGITNLHPFRCVHRQVDKKQHQRLQPHSPFSTIDGSNIPGWPSWELTLVICQYLPASLPWVLVHTKSVLQWAPDIASPMTRPKKGALLGAWGTRISNCFECLQSKFVINGVIYPITGFLPTATIGWACEPAVHAKGANLSGLFAPFALAGLWPPIPWVSC